MTLPGDLPDAPPCPFCGETRTELHSLFGAHASVTTYWCRGCRSPFEQMRWGRRVDPSPPRSDAESEETKSGEKG